MDDWNKEFRKKAKLYNFPLKNNDKTFQQKLLLETDIVSEDMTHAKLRKVLLVDLDFSDKDLSQLSKLKIRWLGVSASQQEISVGI